jgi:hypothetical protein
VRAVFLVAGCLAAGGAWAAEPADTTTESTSGSAPAPPAVPGRQQDEAAAKASSDGSSLRSPPAASWASLAAPWVGTTLGLLAVAALVPSILALIVIGKNVGRLSTDLDEVRARGQQTLDAVQKLKDRMDTAEGQLRRIHPPKGMSEVRVTDNNDKAIQRLDWLEADVLGLQAAIRKLYDEVSSHAKRIQQVETGAPLPAVQATLNGVVKRLEHVEIRLNSEWRRAEAEAASRAADQVDAEARRKADDQRRAEAEARRQEDERRAAEERDLQAQQQEEDLLRCVHQGKWELRDILEIKAALGSGWQVDRAEHVAVLDGKGEWRLAPQSSQPEAWLLTRDPADRSWLLPNGLRLASYHRLFEQVGGAVGTAPPASRIRQVDRLPRGRVDVHGVFRLLGRGIVEVEVG